MAPRAPWRLALLGPAWLALLGPAWLALLGPVRAASLDKTFTFSVAAGQQECFSQPMKRDAILEVEFQVIGGGELDINFVAVSPSGLTVARDEMKQDNTHSIKAVEDGDYTVCFDNTFSRVSSKTVWLEVMVDDLDVQGDWRSFLSSQQMVDVQVDDLQDSLLRVRANLARSGSLQHALRASEARDRRLLEAKAARVAAWSAAQCAALVAVAAASALTLRALFAGGSGGGGGGGGSSGHYGGVQRVNTTP